MELTQVMPIAVGVAVVAALVYAAIAEGQGGRRMWLVPAGAAVGFLIWSVWAVRSEGAFGFWADHTRSLWGNQIWFDLLSAVSIGWWLIVPRARAVGMAVGVWLPVVVATGCIGFLAMFARLMFLEEQRNARSAL